MPFVNDDQRKAAFARMKGKGGNSPRTPRPRGNTGNNQGNYGSAGNFAVGYAGNYTQGTPDWSNWYNNFPTVQKMPAEVFTGQVPDGFTGAFNIVSEQDLDYLPAYGNRPLTEEEKLIAIGYFLLLTGGAGSLFAGIEGGAAAVGVAGTQAAGLTNASLFAGGIEVSINDAPIRHKNPDGSVSVTYKDLYTYIKYEVIP